MVCRFALGLCLAYPVVAFADAPLPFTAGEKLSYDVSLLGVRTAEAELVVETGTGDDLRLTARGRTVGAADSLLHLRQEAWCTLTGPALQPRLCRFISSRRGSDRRREVKFDRAGSLVQERVLEEGRAREERILFADGLDGVQEALSGLYDLRRRLPAVGETVTFRSVRKGKRLDVRATAVGEANVDTPAGTFRTVKVQLHVLQKSSDDETTDGTIWFTQDARRLPVMLRVEAPVGAVEASLRQAAGTVELAGAPRSTPGLTVRGAGTTRGGPEATP